MTIFIICHDGLPEYTPPSGSKILWLNARPPAETRGLDIIPGYDFFENPEALHAQLSGSLGPLAIHKVLVDTPNPEGHVTIWQYRKFLVRRQMGQLSSNYPGMRLVSAGELAAQPLENPETDLAGNEYIVPMPLKAGNIAQHYLTHHSIVDFLHYVATVAAEQVLPQDQILEFFNYPYIVPGGVEMGTYPTAWWMKTCSAMAKVVLSFVEHHKPFLAHDPYQRRAAAFCQERLGGYFLIKHLAAHQPDQLSPQKYGTIHTVTDNGEYRRGT